MNATAAPLCIALTVDNFDDVNRTTCAARASHLVIDALRARNVPEFPGSIDECIAMLTGKECIDITDQLDGEIREMATMVADPDAIALLRKMRTKDGQAAKRAKLLAWYEAEHAAYERINDAYGEVKRATAAAAHDVVDTVAAVVTVDDTAPDAADDPSGEPDIVDVKATVDDGVAAGDTATATDSAPRKRRTPNPLNNKKREPLVTAEQKSRTMAQLVADYERLFGKKTAASRRIVLYHVATAERNIAQGLAPDAHIQRWKANRPKVDEWPTYVERLNKLAERVRSVMLAAPAITKGDTLGQKMLAAINALDDAATIAHKVSTGAVQIAEPVPAPK